MISRLSLALNHLLKWQDICLLATVPTLQEWYTRLEPHSSSLAEALLTSTNVDETDETRRLAPLLTKLLVSHDVSKLVELARAYQMMLHFNASDFILRRILASHPEQPKALGALANLHCYREQYQEAMRHYEHALGLTPDDAWIRTNYGIVLLRLDRIEQAREQWQIVIKQDDKEYAEACVELLAEFL